MKAILNTFSNAMHRVARARTREALLRHTDRQLADAGFSRDLLLAGIDAWPWRTDSAAAEDARDAELMRANRQRAIAELQAMNDRELADLDIARTDIPRAVREGRRGIEVPFERDERIAA